MPFIILLPSYSVFIFLETGLEENVNLSISASTLDQKRENKIQRAKALMKRQLELAIQWDRLDIATEYIFENKSKVEITFTVSNLSLTTI